MEKLEELTSKILGNRPYTDCKQLPFEINCDETLCTFYDCISICPENTIPKDNPTETAPNHVSDALHTYQFVLRIHESFQVIDLRVKNRFLKR